MSDAPQEHVTIIKERGSSGGMMFFGLLTIVLLAVAVYFLSQNTSTISPTDASISQAADKVGAAADKVGEAADEAIKKAN